MIVFAQSCDFPTTYPDNTASDFTLFLLHRENYTPDAQVALLELIVPPSLKAKVCYIYCSIASYTQCNGSWRRVIRVIDIQENKSPEKFTFTNPIYIKLLSNSLEEIRFCLRDENNKLIEFESKAKTVIVFEVKNGTF